MLPLHGHCLTIGSIGDSTYIAFHFHFFELTTVIISIVVVAWIVLVIASIIFSLLGLFMFLRSFGLC